MAYATVATAVTGDIVPAAWGNRVRDNSAYLHGDAGPIALVNALSATGLISSPVGFQSGPGATNQYAWYDRANGTQTWAWYASGGIARLWNSTDGDRCFLYMNQPYLNGAAGALGGFGAHMIGQDVLTGFLGGGGTWTYSYNGNGDIVSQVMNAAGPLNGWAITYEYSGGLVAAMRLRIGGAAGTILRSIGYTYDGAGRISTEGHS